MVVEIISTRQKTLILYRIGFTRYAIMNVVILVFKNTIMVHIESKGKLIVYPGKILCKDVGSEKRIT